MTAAKPDDELDRARRRRSRSLAIAWALGALVVVFYAATIVRLGPNAVNRDTFGTPMGGPPASAPDAACKEAGAC